MTQNPPTIRVARLASLRTVVGVLIILLTSACGPRSPSASIESARQMREKGDHKAAIVELRNLLSAEPGQRDARRLLAQSFLDNGQPGPAEDELRKLIDQGVSKETLLPLLGRALLLQGKHERLIDEIQVDPSLSGKAYAEVALPRGLAYLAMDNHVDGKVILERVIAADPENPDALLGLAGIMVGERRFDDAEKFVDRAIAANPRSLDAWLLKGDMNRLRDRREQALTAYGKALELRPDNIPAHMHLASLHIDAERFDEAGKHVELVRQRRPNDPLANYLFALVEFRKRNYPTAQKAVAQALQKTPGHPPLLLLGGAVELASGQYDTAIRYLRELLERAPGSVLARRLLVVAHLRGGQTQRALEMIDQLVEAFPSDGALLMLAGEAYMQNGDLERAAQFLERASRSDPSNQRALAGLNVARLMSDQSERAMAALEGSLKIETPAPQLQMIYLAALLKRKEYDKVLAALKDLQTKLPENPLVHNLRAAAQLGKGDVAGARRSLENALAVNPRFVPAAINLANLEIREGNPRQALRRLESVLERDPANAQALQALAALGPRIGADANTLNDWLERARRANPSAPTPLVMLAEQNLRAGKPAAALKLANDAQRLNPDNPVVLEVLAAAQLASGDAGGALGTYSKLVLQSPNSPRILQRLAVAQLANKNTAGATITLRKVLGMDPNNVDALLLMGQIDLRANRADSAQGIAKQLQKAFPKLAPGHVLEGDALVAMGKAAAAVPFFETAARLGERGAALTIKRHGALSAAGRTADAQAVLDAHLKTNPNDASVRAYQADTHLFAGRFAQAMEGYLQVLQIQPENPLILNNLAWASYKLKDRRAREFAERALQLAPENPVVLDTTGWILVEAGLVDRGIELLQRALTVAPEARDTRFHLASALMRAGNYNRARREIATALAGSGKFENEAQARELEKQLRQ